MDKRKERAAFLLLELGANPNLPKKPWRSNLKRALEGNAPGLYDALLRHPLTNLSGKDEQDQTLLHVLVQTAPMGRISEVLDVIHDVDINVQDVNGYTSLHLAVSGGRDEVVRKLMTVPGIRRDLADKQGRTAFTLATYWGMKASHRFSLSIHRHFQFRKPDKSGTRFCCHKTREVPLFPTAGDDELPEPAFAYGHIWKVHPAPRRHQ
jgi:ankyrin repeat protein